MTQILFIVNKRRYGRNNRGNHRVRVACNCTEHIRKKKKFPQCFFKKGFLYFSILRLYCPFHIHRTILFSGSDSLLIPSFLPWDLLIIVYCLWLFSFSFLHSCIFSFSPSLTEILNWLQSLNVFPGTPSLIEEKEGCRTLPRCSKNPSARWRLLLLRKSSAIPWAASGCGLRQSSGDWLMYPGLKF